MLMLLALLALAGVGVSVYIAGNGGGSPDVSYLGQHWAGGDVWLPLVAVAGTFGVLALLSIFYGGARVRLLRRANESLRQEVAQLRSSPAPVYQTHAATRAPAASGQPWWRRFSLHRSRTPV